MPRYWYDWHDVKRNTPEDRKDLCFDILAEKKPYFMKYIYPDLGKKYNTYIKTTNCNSLREFGLTVEELKALPEKERTDEQKKFLYYYERMLPVYDDGCVINKICHRFEEEFDNYFKKSKNNKRFDYECLKGEATYALSEYNNIKRLYDNYNKRLRTWAVRCESSIYSVDKKESGIALVNSQFDRNCKKICSNEKTLCNLLLDLCYKKSSSKRSVWSICSHTIIENLLDKHNRTINYPTQDKHGDILFGGLRFTIKSIQLKGEGHDNT